MGKRKGLARRAWVLGAELLITVGGLSGCAGFFDAPTTTTTTTTTANSGDYAYVVNATSDTLTAFSLGTGTLVAISTYTLPAGLSPNSVVVSRQNTFVYVGGSGAIECYTIGSTGALTANTTGGVTALANYRQLATSPDGQWLIALDNLNDDLYVFSINSSTGALTLNQTVVVGTYLPGSGVLTAAIPASVKIAPAGNYVAIALGQSGDELYAFNTTTGMLTSTAGVVTPVGFTDNAVQFDSSSSYLFVARGVTGSSGISSVNTFSISSSGVLSGVQTIASGSAPFGLEMDATGTYLYAANRGDGTISGYSFASGTLTALGTSPYASGQAVTALVRDNSKKYVVAAADGGSSDVTLYALDAVTAGKLDAVSVMASGTDPAGSIAVAATH